MYCKNCGAQIPDQAAFCVRCGVRADSHYEQPPQSLDNGEASKRNRMNHVSRFDFGFCIIKGIAVIFIFLSLLRLLLMLLKAGFLNFGM